MAQVLLICPELTFHLTRAPHLKRRSEKQCRSSSMATCHPPSNLVACDLSGGFELCLWDFGICTFKLLGPLDHGYGKGGEAKVRTEGKPETSTGRDWTLEISSGLFIVHGRCHLFTPSMQPLQAFLNWQGSRAMQRKVPSQSQSASKPR